MALHTKKEFAQLCGITTSNLTTYASRGKVELTGDMVDDTKKINVDFLNYRLQLQKDKETEKQIKSQKVQKEIDLFSSSKPADPTPTHTEEFDTPLARKKAMADLDKKLVDTKKAELEYLILKGKHVPTELVRDLFSELGKSFQTTYKDGADALLTEISHRKKLKPDEHATLKGQLTNLINQAHKKAIATAAREVEALVAAFKKTNKLIDDAA